MQLTAIGSHNLGRREQDSGSGGLPEHGQEAEQMLERGAATHPPRGVRSENSVLALGWIETLN